MTSTELEFFMEKLRDLVYDDNYNNTPIGNNPYIDAGKRYIQWLFEDLAYLIGCCFQEMTVDEQQLDDLEDVGNWKRRIIKAAQQAEDNVDMFLSSAIIMNDYDLHITYRSFGYRYNLLDCSLYDLMDQLEDLNLIQDEITSYCNEKGNSFQSQLVKQETKMDNKFKSTRTSSSGSTAIDLGVTQHEQLIIGFDKDELLIIERLTGYRKKLDITSLVGMGGLGKTTLATKIFNDSLVDYHFDIRGWVTVSQAYSTQNMLLQLLASIGKSVHEAATESKLREILYQSLKGRRYLIVIDDIWSFEVWDDVRLCFPDDNIGSRVLITTRLTEVASHASQGGFTHILRPLTKDQSWELLCKKIFRGYECPESLTETGKHIAKKCGGLPLALVVIAGLLEKGEKSKDLWEKIAERVGSYIVNDPVGCLDTLALSYDHLPCHLKKCFLYVGGFPEDYNIQVRSLIRLWIAEGFIKKSGQRSLEEEGEDYLMGLIDRNLLIVADKRSNGGVKSCRLHDLLRELCLKKASEENFFKKMSMPMSDKNIDFDSLSIIVKQPILFSNYKGLCDIYLHGFATHTRSVLCFNERRMLDSYRTTRWVHSFLLLRVLDLLRIPMVDFRNIGMLIHLRYLAVWAEKSHKTEFSFSEINIWSLQTLIVKGYLPLTYSPDYMVNLRHLWCDAIVFPVFLSVPTLSNLQTISWLRLDHTSRILLESFPDIKKLGCSVSSTLSKDGLLSFAILTHLEALNIDGDTGALLLANPIMFPKTLRKLTLSRVYLPWDYMSTIQKLPKLEVLKLLRSSFHGHLWETGNEQFPQLKFLKLENLDIRIWEASSINFPHLRKLVVRGCKYLLEIPLELGNIYTLEHIETDYSNPHVRESANKMQESQRELGNCDIHVNSTKMENSDTYFDVFDSTTNVPTGVFFEGKPFCD